jgi:nitrate reductase cytochrome c-type subunit
MKNLLVLISLLLVLIAGSLFVTSCTQEVTKTVTLDNTVTTTLQGAQTTVVTTTVVTPIFNREPPEIPHTYLIDMTNRPYITADIPICFECHRIPPFHLDWLQDVDLCNASGCHVISNDPILFR